MKQKMLAISGGAALGFTFMILSVSSLARMVWDTRLQGSFFELWKVYREFLFGTFLSTTFFFIYVPAFLVSMYAIRKYGIEGRPKT